ncbi:unnamed protein product [Orchesella dallaii]|uniref:Envelope fusion protein n=1 Tax=Orchesella dallaii TaxID=48710 RepID=A0ABP1QKB2_9HEXA
MSILQSGLPNKLDFDFPKRRARSIDIIGEALSWCCGVAKQSEITDLHHSQDDLNTLVDKVKAQVATEHDDAIRSNERLNVYSNQMNSFLQDIGNATQDLEREATWLEERIHNIENALALHAKVLHRVTLALNFQKALSDCRKNLIPNNIVSQLHLRAELIELEKELSEHEQRLVISSSKSEAYYFMHETECYFSNEMLIIRINIPVIHTKNTYEMYSVNPLPFYFEGNLCSLQIQADYIAYKNNKQVIALQGQEQKNCIYAEKEFCFLPKHSSTVTHNMKCIEQAINRKSSIGKLKENCAFTCSKLETSEAVVTYISYNEYSIVNPGEHIHIQCRDKNFTRSISKEFLVGMYDIKLNCGCVAFIRNISIEAEFPCRDEKQETESSIMHVLTAQWSKHSENAIVSTDTSYMEAEKVIDREWNKKVPTLNLTASPLPDLDIPLHITSGSFLSYALFIAVLFIVIAIVIAYKKLAGFDRNNLLLPLLNLVTTRMRTARELRN